MFGCGRIFMQANKFKDFGRTLEKPFHPKPASFEVVVVVVEVDK